MTKTALSSLNLAKLTPGLIDKAAAQAWKDAKMIAQERKKIAGVHFRGANQRVFECRNPEVMVSGAAGTGKSVACLTRMHQLAVNYPGFRGLLLRNTRSSLTNTGLVTLEMTVLGMEHPLVTSGARRRYRETYEYPNGSVLDVGGMDKPSKVLSSEYDVIYVQQAEELTEDAWETLLTRLRNYKLPWQQMLGDCNPDKPTHWIKGREKSGALTVLESKHEDNPALWDGSGWTAMGKDYLQKLDGLTGVRKRRLRYGEWVSADGAIYGDYWDRAVHIIDPFKIPPEWPRYRAIDFGYTNPLVCQWWAQDPDGRLYLYREIYKTKLTVADLVTQIKHHERWEVKREGKWIPNINREVIVATITDHDAEDRATLEAEGIDTIAADKRVKVGIEAVQHRLEKAGDGKPRLFVLRGALVEVDPELIEAKKPTCFEDEVDGYVWADKDNKEEPVKRDDHGVDCARMLVMHFDAPGSFGFDAMSGQQLGRRIAEARRAPPRQWSSIGDNSSRSNNRWRLE